MIFKKIELPEKNKKDFDYLIKSNFFSKEELENKKNIPIIKVLKMKRILKKCKTYPIQYLVGNTDFYGYTYKINKNVLIPRFETEELVENTINYINKHFNDNVSVLDLCTGSGCIGITIKHILPNTKVTLSDISKKALKVAKHNAKNIDIKVIISDLLTNINSQYDVIISNPPYISKNEKIMDIVKNNEPNIALYSDNNGLYYYEEILKTCKKNLNKKFLIAFEIGYNQKENIIKLINKYLENVNIICKKDLQNKDRMIFIMNK